MKRQIKKLKVYVAMSGGVDSSVAAALLKKQGYDVTGVFMKPWSPDYEIWNMEHRIKKNNPYSIVHSPCPWQRDREDAMRVAAKIGIPLLTWDFSKEYKREVADYMIREYRVGRTPNPDVMCNRHIKFGVFLDKALKVGADYIATGHYVRIRQTTNDQRLTTKSKKTKKSSVVSCRLLVAADKNKDQSYFLWTLTQKQLKYCLFPIGDYTKPEVRKMAKKFGLPTAGKKDSQGVCFIGPLDIKDFLKNYIKPKPGKIVLTRSDLVSQGRTLNKVIGTHDGVFYYTIGQRHGLDIKDGKGPYYVVDKDVKKNIIYVGGKNDLKGHEIKVTDANWVSDGIKMPAKVNVKIRYRSKSIPVTISPGNFGYYILHTTYSILYAVTPGQSAVFYKGEEMLGGGIIM